MKLHSVWMDLLLFYEVDSQKTQKVQLCKLLCLEGSEHNSMAGGRGAWKAWPDRWGQEGGGPQGKTTLTWGSRGGSALSRKGPAVSPSHPKRLSHQELRTHITTHKSKMLSPEVTVSILFFPVENFSLCPNSIFLYWRKCSGETATSWALPHPCWPKTPPTLVPYPHETPGGGAAPSAAPSCHTGRWAGSEHPAPGSTAAELGCEPREPGLTVPETLRMLCILEITISVRHQRV